MVRNAQRRGPERYAAAGHSAGNHHHEGEKGMPVEYSATSQIGKGVKPLAQNGQVVIANGLLTLRDSKGNEIVAAPVDEVTAKSPWYAMGNGTKVTIAGTSYFLSLKSLAGAAIQQGAIGIFVGRKRTKAFTAALAQARAEAVAA
jgi:hypothetical protein